MLNSKDIAEFHNLRSDLGVRPFNGYDNKQHYLDSILFHFGLDKTAIDFAKIVNIFDINRKK